MEEQQAALQMMLCVTECLVDHPEKLVVEATVSNTGTAFVVTPHPEDVGKLIGKAGRTARAIRTILSGVSMNHKTRYTLDIREGANGAAEKA